MSLKAKLEAVIYAAEEPVTLAQLAALFAADALEWKAEQAAASAAQAAEDAEDAQPEPAEHLSLLAEGFAYLELEQTTAFDAAEPTTEPGSEPIARPGSEPAPDSASIAAPAEAEAPTSSAAETGTVPETSPGDALANPADSEGELRRQARLQDREVRAILLQLLEELIASYASGDRGVEIREIAGGYRMGTKPECHDAVRMFVRSLKPPLKLSLPALETLAVIAYKQPVTAPEVNEIRGVESSATLGSLLSRKLIATAGRKPVIGRPILYKTTREFLLRFGLKDISELPSMEEFEKMAAIELEDREPAVESGFAPEPAEEGGFEFSEEPIDGSDEAASIHAPEPAPAPPIHTEPVPTEAAPAAPPPTEQAETEASRP